MVLGATWCPAKANPSHLPTVLPPQKIEHKQKLAAAHGGKPWFTLKQYIYEITQEFILMLYNLAHDGLHHSLQLATI